MGMRGIIHNWLASTHELVSIIIAIVVNLAAFIFLLQPFPSPEFVGSTVKINFRLNCYFMANNPTCQAPATDIDCGQCDNARMTI